ncbi:MAG: hypothetical protein MHM6MM_007733 [Cercozoa sp. M6MM]
MMLGTLARSVSAHMRCGILPRMRPMQRLMSEQAKASGEATKKQLTPYQQDRLEKRLTMKRVISRYGKRYQDQNLSQRELETIKQESYDAWLHYVYPGTSKTAKKNRNLQYIRDHPDKVEKERDRLTLRDLGLSMRPRRGDDNVGYFADFANVDTEEEAVEIAGRQYVAELLAQYDATRERTLRPLRPVMNWEETSSLQKGMLTDETLEQLEKLGMPLPCQQRCIPAVLSQDDVVLQAETGSGKSLAFLVPILASLSEEYWQQPLSTIIMVPTAALAAQLGMELRHLAPNALLKNPDTYHLVSVANSDYQDKGHFVSAMLNAEDINDLPAVVIATPPYLQALSNRVNLSDHVRRIVVDEADATLNVLDVQAHKGKQKGSFSEGELKWLFRPIQDFPSWLVMESLQTRGEMRKTLQTILVSATTTSRLRDLVEEKGWLRSPRVIAQGDPLPRQSLRLRAVDCDTQDRKFTFLRRSLKHRQRQREKGNVPALLLALDNNVSVPKTIERLRELGFAASSVQEMLCTSDVQHQIAARQLLAEGRVEVLVGQASELRGLDLFFLKDVIMLSPPPHVADFIHISGRTARLRTPGTVTLLVGERPEDKEVFKRKASAEERANGGDDTQRAWRRQENFWLRQAQHAAGVQCELVRLSDDHDFV